jgi:hypothetical protein
MMLQYVSNTIERNNEHCAVPKDLRFPKDLYRNYELERAGFSNLETSCVNI